MGSMIDDLMIVLLSDHQKDQFHPTRNDYIQDYVDFRGTKSKYRNVKQRVPQGGVMSPVLHNRRLHTGSHQRKSKYSSSHIRLNAYF